MKDSQLIMSQAQKVLFTAEEQEAQQARGLDGVDGAHDTHVQSDGSIKQSDTMEP